MNGFARKRRRIHSRPERLALEQRTLLSALVALVDTGVDLSSTADAPYYDLAAGYNAYTEQTTAQAGDWIVQDNYTPGGGFGHYHGSTVADNIVAGIRQAEAQPGGAGQSVEIMPIRVTTNNGGVDINSLIRGVYYAANHGANVINISIASSADPVDTDPSDPYFGQSLSDAIAYAETKNIVVVTAPGNNAANIDDPTNPISIYPADTHSANMIVAAAVTSSGALSSVSNWGPIHVDLGAVPANNAPETSYSAGMTSGIVGVLEALAPSSWTGDQMAQYVKATAAPDPALAGKTTTGGVIDPAKAVAGLAALKSGPPSPQGPALPEPIAVSLGQDGSDFTGLSATPAPDGFQDVHIKLSNLDASLPISRVVVNRLGGGGLYLSDGSPGSWSDLLNRPQAGAGYSSTGDLYFQPNRNDFNYPYQIDVYYQGASAPVTTFVRLTAIASYPDNPGPSAASLGQDGSDVAGLGANPASDGFQDVHIELGNLITSLPIARVEVDRLGGGGLYRSDGSAWSWSTVVVRPAAANGFGNTADLYFQPNVNSVDYPYQINVYYQGLANPLTTFVRVTAQANLPDPKTPVATSLGQDGSDLAGLAPTAGADGYQDVHVRISGIAAGTTVERIAVRRDGGGGDYLSTGAAGTWMAVSDLTTLNAGAVDSVIADLYFQPAQDNVNQLFWIDIFEIGLATPITIPVHVSDLANLPDPRNGQG